MNRTAQINFIDELIVDSFAGGGGASTGIELAIGRPVDIAINHDPDAIKMHEINHKFTRHYCEDVWKIDPPAVTRRRPVALLWASPDCKHFSKAKGGKPVEKKIRGLAWVVLRWAGKVRPRVIILENVEEFQTWCPIKKGKPVKSRTGETFNKFITQLRALGYAVEWRELKACDYGAPTIRKRLFLVARCDGLPIVFPEPTHGKGKGLKPYRTAADIIDFSLPTPSIFKRKKPLAENTLRRIARGLEKFVINNPRPFILMCNHASDKTHAGRDLKDPLHTITQKPGDGVVNPTLAPFVTQITQTGFSQDRARAADEPLSTICVKNDHCAAEAKLAPILLNHKFSNEAESPDSPLSTVTAVNAHEVAAAKLKPYVMTNTSRHACSGTQEPVSTVTTGGHHYIIEPTVQQLGQNGFTKEAVKRAADSLTTITAKANHAVAVPYITKFQTDSTGQTPDEPLGTAMAGATRFAAVNPCIIPVGYGERKGQLPRVGDSEEPLSTVVSTCKQNLAVPYISKYFAGGYTGAGSAVDDPLGTVTALDHNALVENHLCVLRRNTDCKALTEPIPTLTASPGHMAKVDTRLAKIDAGGGFGNWAAVRELLNKYADRKIADDEILIFDIGGVPYFICDIGMRMLEPRELFNAQGFPPDYLIDIETVTGKPYSKAKQIARCGNSVCPPMAESLVRANLPEICGRRFSTMKEFNEVIAL